MLMLPPPPLIDTWKCPSSPKVKSLAMSLISGHFYSFMGYLYTYIASRRITCFVSLSSFLFTIPECVNRFHSYPCLLGRDARLLLLWMFVTFKVQTSRPLFMLLWVHRADLNFHCHKLTLMINMCRRFCCAFMLTSVLTYVIAPAVVSIRSPYLQRIGTCFGALFTTLPSTTINALL